MEKLIRYIEAHGQVAVEQDGELMVLSHGYGGDLGADLGFGRVGDGRSYFEWERIAANLNAVRDWLGY